MYALPYACIFMGQVESKFLQTQLFHPLARFRCIFFILTHGENILKKFMMEFNNFNPNIKFTFKFSSESSINFLDLNVSDGKCQTSLFVEPTDRHQYLHCQSSHPKHTKRSLVYSQTLRVSRAYSIILDE